MYIEIMKTKSGGRTSNLNNNTEQKIQEKQERKHGNVIR